jgi:hypothetical protein
MNPQLESDSGGPSFLSLPPWRSKLHARQLSAIRVVMCACGGFNCLCIRPTGYLCGLVQTPYCVRGSTGPRVILADQCYSVANRWAVIHRLFDHEGWFRGYDDDNRSTLLLNALAGLLRIITQQHSVLRPGIVRRDERTVRRFGPPFGIASKRFCSQTQITVTGWFHLRMRRA